MPFRGVDLGANDGLQFGVSGGNSGECKRKHVSDHGEFERRPEGGAANVMGRADYARDTTTLRDGPTAA